MTTQQPQKKEITLNLPEMRKLKFMIATPMYGGMCHGMYTKSLMDTISMMTGHGVPAQLYFMFNESLITRARNYCVANFLKSDCTHLWFIDSDITWKAQDALYMMHLMAEDPDKLKIFTALYPKKVIAWEKIIKAAKTGLFDEAPDDLELIAGDMVFNPHPTEYPDGRAPVFEPVRVKEAGTGFMFIERSVFEKYGDEHPELWYTPDHLREAEFMADERICAYFDCVINEQDRYLSEDYMFCQNADKLGYKVYTLPHIELMHCGSHIFSGSVLKMAQLDLHPTIDPDHAKKVAESAGKKPQKNSS
jgi:hypothetical protein